MAAPIPREPPVTSATRFCRDSTTALSVMEITIHPLGASLLSCAPLPGSRNKRLEQFSRRIIAVKSAFRVPLDGHDVMSGQRALQRFDHSVLRAAGRDAQAVANRVR